tara:strand:+ start:733 stop:996 length:264 start_codon:yes stop_codon:yes gene_type:complete
MSRQSSSGASWEKLRLKVLERDAWTCSFCGKHLVGGDATVDHVVAKANGGEDRMDNCIAACRLCNGIKQDRVLIRMPWVNSRWLDAI